MMFSAFSSFPSVVITFLFSFNATSVLFDLVFDEVFILHDVSDLRFDQDALVLDTFSTMDDESDCKLDQENLTSVLLVLID